MVYQRFSKMCSKELLQVESPALNMLNLEKLNFAANVVFNTEAQDEALLWGIAASKSLCQS